MGERRGGARGLLQAAAESLGRWHVNAPDAPEVTGATIKIARQVAMAGEEEEAAAKAAADAEEHAALTAAIVARITAPFAGTPPLHFALIGFGTTFLIIALFFLAEKLWLQARPRPRPHPRPRRAPRARVPNGVAGRPPSCRRWRSCRRARAPPPRDAVALRLAALPAPRRTPLTRGAAR